MTQKLNITVLCGGQSTEHEVSILSARNVVTYLNPQKYEITVIYITHQGEWHLIDKKDFLEQPEPWLLIQARKTVPIAIAMGDSHHPWMSLQNPQERYAVDCVFPVLHGTNSEDGTVQGLLELLNIPYVGSDVLSSAVCMQKDIAKNLLRQANIPTPDWFVLTERDVAENSYEQLIEVLGKTLFVKPSNLGSSVGVAKVKTKAEFEQALKEAFRYDQRVLVEPFVKGREIECSVLGNEEPIASLPGEIIAHHEFYSYDAKYIDKKGADVVVPANLNEKIIQRVQSLSVAAYKVLHCLGMARVDFFVCGEKVLVNELNTIPGFTNISMYPKNWEVSGLSYAKLLDRLIELGLTYFRQKLSLIRVKKTDLLSSNSKQPIPDLR